MFIKRLLLLYADINNTIMRDIASVLPIHLVRVFASQANIATTFRSLFRVVRSLLVYCLCYLLIRLSSSLSAALYTRVIAAERERIIPNENSDVDASWRSSRLRTTATQTGPSRSLSTAATCWQSRVKYNPRF